MHIEDGEEDDYAAYLGVEKFRFLPFLHGHDQTVGGGHGEGFVGRGNALGITEEIKGEDQQKGKENGKNRQKDRGKRHESERDQPTGDQNAENPSGFRQGTKFHGSHDNSRNEEGEPIVEFVAGAASLFLMTATGDMTMSELLTAFPGAQRALFRNYHVGGCSSCGFRPDETLAEVCQRNDGLDPEEVLEKIRLASEEDQKMMVTPAELKALLDEKKVQLLDIRTQEEYDAVHIEGSRRLTQPFMQEALSTWPKDSTIVVLDHDGKRSLDAVAYFTGHGFTAIKCLRGGIDAWSQEVDPSLPRYTLE